MHPVFADIFRAFIPPRVEQADPALARYIDNFAFPVADNFAEQVEADCKAIDFIAERLKVELRRAVHCQREPRVEARAKVFERLLHKVCHAADLAREQADEARRAQGE